MALSAAGSAFGAERPLAARSRGRDVLLVQGEQYLGGLALGGRVPVDAEREYEPLGGADRALTLLGVGSDGFEFLLEFGHVGRGGRLGGILGEILRCGRGHSPDAERGKAHAASQTKLQLHERLLVK